MKRNYKITSKFSFKPVSEEFVKDIVNNLSSNKAAGGEIPLKILKEYDFSFHFLTNCIKEAIVSRQPIQHNMRYLGGTFISDLRVVVFNLLNAKVAMT